MSDYNSLKAAINANIRKNGRQEITGQVLNGILRAMVDALGAGFTFRAVASPDTDPGSTDSRVFYIATTPGAYEHMGGIEIEEGEVAILKFYDNAWHKEPTGLASQAALESLGDTLEAAIGEKMTFCELWCDGDKITRKNDQTALTFSEVKDLMDDPSQFVALKYIDVFWMLPQYDDEGGAIIFTGVSLMSAQGDLWRIAINEENQISDYSIAIENQYLKTDDLTEEKRGGFKTYPTTQAVNAALDDKVNKVPGEGLSSNDFTTQEKNKLAGLNNYDDTELRSQVQSGVTAASGSAAQAAASAASAESKYAGILQAMENLPDGSAVSAQVALNTQKVTELEGKVDSLALGKFYGFFPNSSSLPSATDNGYAYVGDGILYDIFNAINGNWTNSGASVSKENVYVTPELFGAKGDGVTDDADALLLAFSKASQNGGKVIFTEGKTYLVNSNPSEGTTLFPFESLSIEGNGSEIKIGNIGDYHAIFSIRGGVTDIRDIVLTLSDDNATTADTGVTDKGRRIDFEVGTRGENLGEVYLDGITINNACGVWQFDLIRVKKAVVKNCVVNYTNTPLTYDRTSCYLWGENIEFANNTLNGSESALTGVEFHGTNINVHDNYIRNYRRPIFIVNDLNDMGLTKTEALRLTNNYCHCKRGLEIWASLAYDMGDIIIEDNSFIISEKDYYAFNIFPHANNCTIDNIIVKGNRFLQINEEATLASIRFNPLRWRGSEDGSFLIKNMQFNGNHFLSRSVYLMSLGCTIDADIKIDNIEFISNIFDSQSNIVANIDNGKNTFTSIHFVNNVFKNNTNYIILPYNANGMDIRFDDNVFQKKVGVFSSESGKECITLYGGHINADYMTNIPNVKVNTCFDNNGLLPKLDTVKVYAEAATTITAKEGTTISVPKGWSEVSIGAGFHIFNAVTKVDFSGMKLSLISLYNAFGGFKGKKIDLSMMDFSRVTSLSTAFANSYIERIDLSSVNASALTGLSSTFYNCTELRYIDISGFDYSKVGSLQGMFGLCENLEELHLGKFNTKENANVSGIFQNTYILSKVTLECATQASITNVEQLLSLAHPSKTIMTTKTAGAISDTFNAVIIIVEQVVE